MRPTFELAEIIERYGKEFTLQHNPNVYIRRTLSAILRCRTSALGGHVDKCDQCGHIRISYNSCRNRHCPKCQNTQREAWIESRKADLIPVPYFHVVFTLPDKLNGLFLQHNRLLYNLLFATVWETIAQFSYTRLQAETGMVAVLHTCLPAVQDFGRWGVKTFRCTLTCIVSYREVVSILKAGGSKSKYR